MLHRVYWGDPIKKDEMGETCSMHGKNDKCVNVLENLNERGNSEGLGVDGMIISEWIIWKTVVKCGLDAADSEQGLVSGPYEHGNEPSGSIKGGNFLIRSVIISFF
jgi:hypothetical protein